MSKGEVVLTKAPLRVDFERSVADIAADVGGDLRGDAKGIVRGVCLDSRSLRSGDLFVAIRADRDGHDFVSDAIGKGASACLVEKPVEGTNSQVVVSDSMQALGRLARSARDRWGKSVVGISGSNGKTTTKEMTAAILGSNASVLKAPGTWNNSLGVPLTLLMLRDSHDVAVLELGISHAGEMTTLCEIAAPNIGILTNIGPTHLEKLGSVEGVARAKGELFAALGSGDFAVVNKDDRKIPDLAKHLKAKIIAVSLREAGDVSATIEEHRVGDGYRLKLKYGRSETDLRTTLPGEHNIHNLLCALGAALALRVPVDRLQAGVDAIRLPELRLEVVRLSSGIRIINDCYNANPASTVTALEVCREIGAGRKIAVLGDMMELGEFGPRAHRDVGIEVARRNYDQLFVLGQYATDVVQGAIQGGMARSKIEVGKSREDFAKAIGNALLPGDVVLVKGSRGMRMEEITDLLVERMGREA